MEPRKTFFSRIDELSRKITIVKDLVLSIKGLILSVSGIVVVTTIFMKDLDIFIDFFHNAPIVQESSIVENDNSSTQKEKIVPFLIVEKQYEAIVHDAFLFIAEKYAIRSRIGIEKIVIQMEYSVRESAYGTRKLQDVFCIVDVSFHRTGTVIAKRKSGNAADVNKNKAIQTSCGRAFDLAVKEL